MLEFLKCQCFYFYFFLIDRREKGWHDLGESKALTEAGRKVVKCSVINERRHRHQPVKEESILSTKQFESVTALGK